MRCQYVFRGYGTPCRNEVVDGRKRYLPNGDWTEDLFCAIHCQAFDVIMAAHKERKRKAAEQAAACRLDPAAPFVED